MSKGSQLPSSKNLKSKPLLQLCILPFGLFQDGDVGVGFFPEVELTHRLPMPAMPVLLA